MRYERNKKPLPSPPLKGRERLKPEGHSNDYNEKLNK
jgi:hypothetical protein